MQGTRSVVLLRYFGYGDSWVELSAWASLSRYSANQEIFTRILDSVEVQD